MTMMTTRSPWRRACTLTAMALVLCAIPPASICVSSHAAAPIVRDTQVHIVAIHPHNASSFTEGLFYMDDTLVESTGLRHHSYIRQYRLTHPSDAQVVANQGDDDEDNDDSSGDDDDTPDPVTKPSFKSLVKEYKFDTSIFGEGIASIGDKVFALTYKQNKILVLNKATFKLESSHPFHTSTGEGWGMTTNGTHLIVSDGSSSIQFFDPKQNFKKVNAITVKDPKGSEVTNLNELEYVDGEILANVWFKNTILRIDPTDGHVIEALDFEWLPAMVPNLQSMGETHMKSEAVMNGIAFNTKNRHVYVTGKLWDSIFELELSCLKRPRQH